MDVRDCIRYQNALKHFIYLFIYKWQRATSATNMSHSTNIKISSKSINTKALQEKKAYQIKQNIKQHFIHLRSSSKRL